MSPLILTALLVVLATPDANGMVCNGMAGLCPLRFDQVSFAGSHNSGSNGNMKHNGAWTWVSASACWFKNQDLSFTGQLDYGIRFFDIDTCYDSKRSAKIWTCHGDANREPLKYPLEQIANWLNQPRRRNEVIAVRFHDTNAHGISHFDSLLRHYFGGKNGKVGMNGIKNGHWNVWPTLEEAIKENARVFVFMSNQICDSNCRKKHSYSRPVSYTDTWKSRGLTSSCVGVVEDTKQKCRSHHQPLLLASIFASYGLCLYDLQKKCNPHIRSSVFGCYNIIKNQGKTVNFVVADFVNKAKSHESVVTVARDLNYENIKFYTGNRG